jgi:hypothetical protein
MFALSKLTWNIENPVLLFFAHLSSEPPDDCVFGRLYTV